MFINDVNKKEEIRNVATKQLRKLGIKQRVKHCRPIIQNLKTKKLFRVPLQNLENETITLTNGQQLVVPKRLYEMCSFILTKVETEGLFRKEGSKSRQNEIKLSLDRGCMLGNEHHVIDVAVVLKCFLRELPESLIPYSFHELFIRCSIIEKKAEAILLACLLIPTEHLNVLAFLMQFFSEIDVHSKFNKMNSYNISLIIAPNIFPLNEKLAPKNKLMVKKTCDIVKVMIDNSTNIGLIPDYILEQVGNLRPGELDIPNKIKRRRSGSLTRIFNGLKKIVTNKTDDIAGINTVTPDLLLTPSINLTKKSNTNEIKLTNQKLQTVNNKRTMLVRRWSAITSATNLKRKKRNSFIGHLQQDSSLNSSKEDYVRVPKVEYEEIKNRVSAIEKRLSLELESVQSQSAVVHNEVNIIQGIQTAYEQTLGQTTPLSPGTDQLARRLSRDLRIRNSEQKIIRSPSARKIGNIRRRSREIVRNNSLQLVSKELKGTKLTRSVSSPISNNIRINTNVFGTPSFTSNTNITFNSTGNIVNTYTPEGISSLEMIVGSPSSTNILDKNFPRNSSLRRERRILRRSGNITPKKTYLKQKYRDGQQFVEGKEENKENNLVEKEFSTPVPHIKRALPVKGTPKRFCTTTRGTTITRNTPLRVLPSTPLSYF